ncbi:MAG: hypothetical protein Q4G04_06545, partial [bacterium]|nr:hypothetical protein [bacterium]
MQNQNFSFTINAEAGNCPANLDNSGANAPVLAEGMIPIYFAETSCSTISNPTYEDYPSCYDVEYSISNSDRQILLDYLVNDWYYSLEEAETIMEEILTSPDYYSSTEGWFLDGLIDDYYSYGRGTIQMNTNITFNGAKYFPQITKADSANMLNTWYNYSDKLWANAVMVSTNGGGVTGSQTRQQYMDAAPGTPVLESDILSYYVWMPRYRYTLFNVGTDIVSEQLIEVTFETADTQKSTGSTVGSQLTHPAFTWGAGESIQELDGIWVGKFETTGTTSSPTVKPSLSPLVSQPVYGYYNANKTMDSEIYLTTTGVSEIDVHMLKNTEWGAVAYLKQSAYGLGTTKIAENSVCSDVDVYGCYNGFITGCGSPDPWARTTSICRDYTSSSGQNASTTGNITGVYDMSGGTWEYVMGVYSNSSGTTISYGSGGSSFSPTLSCTANTYVNCYLAPSSSSDYAKRILGDATAETRAWYSDYAVFVVSSNPWFARGGDSQEGWLFGFDRSDSLDPGNYFNNNCGSRASAFVIPS